MTGTAQTPSVTATANLDTEITSKNRSTTTVTVKSSTKAHLKKFTNLFQPIRQIPLTWTLALLTCAVFTLTVCYASFATVAARSRMISTSWSNTILVLRVLSGITELLMIALLAATFERIQWMLVSRTRGLSLLSFLGLSSGVSVLGLLWLVFMRGARKWSCRSWSIFRLVLLVYVPVLGYVIMSDVQAREIFITHPEFRVAAGIGTFNASFAKDYAPIAGIYFATDFTRFLDNPSIVYPVEPVQNPTSHCTTIATQRNSPACSASYFVSSGLENISPWPSKNADFPDAGAYVVKDIAGYQFDFGELQTGERFDGTKDCRIYGDDVAAIQLCISTFDENTLIAKYAHCPIDIAVNSACRNNTSWASSTGWTTTMKVYNRRATTNFSRYNATILSLGTLSTPKPVFISAPDLLSVYSTMFGAPASGGIRANAAAYQFLTYISSYLTYAETSPTTFTTAGTYLRNLLALPLFYFHANNLSPTTFPSPDKPLPGLPEQLYTTAALAEPAYRVVVGRPSLWAYIGGGSALLALCLCALVMGSLIGFAGNVPETGVWPTVDFVRNCRAGGNDNADGEENNELGGRLRTCWGLQGRDLRRSIADIRLFVREGST